MIIDSLSNAEKYESLHPLFAQAFAFIKSQNLATISSGKYAVDEDVSASVFEKEGVQKEEAKFEAHDHFIDIQVCPKGTETFGWKPRNKCSNVKTPYHPEKDVTFYKDEPDMFFELHEGQFVIFYPEDVHAPGIGEGLLKKLVVKVKK